MERTSFISMKIYLRYIHAISLIQYKSRQNLTTSQADGSAAAILEGAAMFLEARND